MTHRLPLLVSLLIGLMQMGTTSTVFASPAAVRKTTQQKYLPPDAQKLIAKHRALQPGDFALCCGAEDCESEYEVELGTAKFEAKVKCDGPWFGVLYLEGPTWGGFFADNEDSYCDLGFGFGFDDTTFKLEAKCKNPSGFLEVELKYKD